jgi:hypothetical protein
MTCTHRDRPTWDPATASCAECRDAAQVAAPAWWTEIDSTPTSVSATPSPPPPRPPFERARPAAPGWDAQKVVVGWIIAGVVALGLWFAFVHESKTSTCCTDAGNCQMFESLKVGASCFCAGDRLYVGRACD